MDEKECKTRTNSWVRSKTLGITPTSMLGTETMPPTGGRGSSRTWSGNASALKRRILTSARSSTVISTVTFTHQEAIVATVAMEDTAAMEDMVATAAMEVTRLKS